MSEELPKMVTTDSFIREYARRYLPHQYDSKVWWLSHAINEHAANSFEVHITDYQSNHKWRIAGQLDDPSLVTELTITFFNKDLNLEPGTIHGRILKPSTTE